MKNILLDHIREARLICQYYSPFLFSRVDEGKMVFVADGRFPHGGMFDRLKGAVSVYAAAQCIGREFRISFSHPFDLRDYLEPAAYDWRIDAEALAHRFPLARPIFMYGEGRNPKRLVRRRGCESHFYLGFDALEWLNRRFGANFEFGELYRQLFRPTAKLYAYIRHYREEIGGKYIAAHFRFMNLIGDTTEFTSINPTLPEYEQKVLIEKSLEQLRLVAQHPLVANGEARVMLATDSAVFTNVVREAMPQVYVAPGEIRHIGTATDNSDASNIKMFLDYYLIAGAEKVYNFVSNGMWKSAFPEYAAKIGNAPFERIFY